MLNFAAPIERWTFVVGQTPKSYSKSTGWNEMRPNPLSASEWRDLAHELLSVSSSGIRRVQESWLQVERVGNQLFVSKLDLTPPALIPEDPMMDRFLGVKKSGLGLFITQDIGTLICLVAPRMPSFDSIVFVSDQGLRREMWESLRPGEAVGFDEVNQTPRHVTLIVDMPAIPRVVDLVETRLDEGQKILWFIPGKSLLGGLFRWLDCRQRTAVTSVKAGEHLELLQHLVSVPHPETFEKQFFLESLSLTALARGHLSQETLKVWISENPQEYRSLNQSLIQGLLKRSISLRTAFELSPDPSKLDSDLKSIGY